jgi:peptidyl-tRNA hydrolase
MTLKRAKPEAKTVELLAVVALKHDPLLERLKPVAQVVHAAAEVHALQLLPQAVQLAGVAKYPAAGA